MNRPSLKCEWAFFKEKIEMKFISWNVNGIRACVTKGFLDYFHEMDADFFCIQESKCQAGQIFQSTAMGKNIRNNLMNLTLWVKENYTLVKQFF